MVENTVSLRKRPGQMRRDHDPCALTPAEQRLWEHHLKGLTNRQIAEALGLKESSIIRTKVVIKQKLEAA